MAEFEQRPKCESLLYRYIQLMKLMRTLMEEKKIAKRKNVSELSRIIFGLGKEVSRTE